MVTEAVMRIRPLPETAQYGAFLFPDLATGVRFLREVARHRCAPSSIRLVDNEQFRFGLALKPPVKGVAPLPRPRRAGGTRSVGSKFCTLTGARVRRRAEEICRLAEEAVCDQVEGF